MNKFSFHSKSCEMPLAAEPRAFYFSRLMSPQEVESATAQYPQQVREVIRGKWSLCGDVCSQMFALLRTKDLSQFPARMTGFRSSGGMTYAVVTHQIAGFQSRIVMSLSDPHVRQFLRAMQETSLVFLLGHDGKEESVLFGSPLQPSMFLPLLAMQVEPTHAETEAQLEEVFLVMQEMGKPSTIPSLTSASAVQHVSVSMVLSDVVHDAVAASMQKAEGLC